MGWGLASVLRRVRWVMNAPRQIDGKSCAHRLAEACARRFLAVLVLLATALMPAVAQASTGCDAIQAGTLNHTTTFSGNAISSTTAKGTTGTNAVSTARTANSTSDGLNPAGASWVPNGTTTYDYTVGDVITLSATVSSFATGSGQLRAAVRYGTGPTANSTAGTILTFMANGSNTITYTVTSATTAVGLQTYNSGAGNGTIMVTGSCAPVPTAMITSITPTSTTASNPAAVTATINGSNFSASGNAVTFTNPGSGTAIPATVVAENATSISVTVPSSGSSGVSTVTVTTTGGQTATTSFRYVPSITAVAPTSGPTDGGTSVVLNGTGFTGATAVQFGGTPATTFTLNSNTQITAVAPAKVAGTTNITVTTSGGTSANTPSNSYRYVTPPTVTSVTPNAGPAGGGQSVTIAGTNLTGATSVTFDGTPATNVVVAGGGNSLTATTPAHAAGVVTVAVTTTGGGTSSLANGYTYAATPAAPVVTTPANGSQVNTTTPTYSGTAPANATVTVYVDGTSVGTTTATAGGAFTFTQPSALAQVSHTVYTTATTAGGTSANSNTNTFTVDSVAPAVPVVSTPADGSSTASTTPTVSGTAEAGATVTVVIDGTDRGTTTATGGTFTFTSPTLALGSHTVAARATDTAGNSSANSAANTFTVVALPTVTSVSPTQGTTAGDTPITINGTNFTNGSTVTVGGAPATNVAFVSSTQLTARTPGGTAGAAVVAVTNAAGTSTTNGTFTYVTPPTADNQSVTTAFNTATAITLTGSNATSYTVATAPAHGTLSGTAPNLNFTPTAGYSGADSFTFTTSNGAGTSAPATVSITVTAPLPSVSGVLPSQGTTAGGTTVTITGSGFSGVTAVTFGGAPAASFTFNSPTQITAVTPNGTAGAATVAVTTPSGTSTTNGTFTYVTPPTANDQSVTTAFNTATAITLTGTNVTSYTVATAPAHGTLSGTAPNLNFTPTAGYRGADSFTFTTSNGAGTSAPAMVSITVGNPTLTLNGTPPAGTRGAAYTFSFTTTGGTSPYTYSVTGGALPGGLTLAQGGTLSGTPIVSGSFPVTVTVTDSTPGNPPVTTSASYTIVIAPPTLALTPSAGALPTASSGTAYSQTFAATGGTGPYTYTVTGGALPAGLTLAPGGTLSGTPSAAGNFSFTVTATDSASAASGGPYAVSNGYTLAVTAAAISIAPATLPAASVGLAYSQTLTASGGTPGYSYAVTAGALPAGLSLASGGTLSGTPTAGGTFNFTITATDSSTGTGAPFSGNRAYALTVGAATIAVAPATLPAATAGQSYAQNIAATGGTAPYSYAISAGALPAGLTISTAGQLSGTPTQSGSFTFAVQATDSSTGSGPYVGTRSYTLVVNAPTLTVAPATLANAMVGAVYSQAITATGGTAPYSYAVTAGALPAGLTLASDGTLSGTPTAGGSFTFSVTATDANNTTASRAYTLTVTAATVAIAPASLPNGQSGAAYSQAITATGGTAPYSYAVTAGALPAGLTLSATGTLSGTPTASGSFTFSVTATDTSTGTGPYAGTRSYTLTIGMPTLALSPATLTDAIVGAAYNQTVTASGGTAPYAYAVTAGALPAGITLSAGGVVSGTPTAGGSFGFTVTATDSTAAGSGGPYTASRSYTLAVAAATVAIAPATLPNGQSGVAYSQAVSASGGTAPYSYAVTAGALPAGVTLATTGTLSGTPTASGSFTFSVAATDSSTGTGPYAGMRSYTLTIAAPTLMLNQTSVAPATVGTAYSQVITASGGTAPYSYAVTAGALPAGIALAADGTLAGTPTAGGTFTFTVTATDSTAASNGGPYTASRSYTLTVATATVAIAPASLPNGQSGAAYSQAITASGGTAPYSYTVTAGALPAGLTLSATGTLSGTPTASGSFTFSVTATDTSTGTGPYAGTRSYTLTIGMPTLALSPATLTDAIVGAAYNQTVTASGGTAPYAYAVTAGALPAGITLSAGGVVSGTPTAGGSFGFTVTATDSTAAGSGGPYTASRSYTLAVAAATVAIAPATLPNGQSGVAYSQAVSASGGTAPYSYAVTAGALPAGVTLATTGTLSGTPTASGSFTFSVAATDSSTGTGPYAGMRSYTLTIAAPTLTLAPATLTDATVGTAYSQAITASGGTAPYSYAVTAGALPAGIALGPDGTLSGTPTAGGSFTLTITVTDATSSSNGGPYSASSSYTLTVAAAAVAIAPASLPAGTYQVAYSQTLTGSGGTAPYRYVVTAGALPAGITLSATGTLAGTPTTFGDFNITVSATDSSTGTGPYAGTRAYTLTIAAPAAPTAGSVAVSVGYNSANNPVPLQLSGSTATNVAVASAPAHGTATASGTTIAYTPATGFSGTDSFTYTASNGGGTSAPATVTVTVGAPAIALVPATLPAAQQGIAYSATLSASGGAAPYRYAVTAGRLPQGLTLSVGGTLSGTPSEPGSFQVSITATDSSTGNGPFSATNPYTLAVAAPAAPTAGNVSVTVAYGSANNLVPLQIGGGTATAVTVASTPTHGTATASGATITYTPAAGYAGPDSFTYTASNGGGTSAPATVSVTVSGSSVTLAPATLPSGQQDATYSQTLTAAGGTAPYRYAVTAGRLPNGVTLSANGVIAGTPTENGNFAFSVTATDSSTGTGPFTASNAYTLSIALPAPPVARSSASSVSSSTTVTSRSVSIDLSALVTGDYNTIRIATPPQHGTVSIDATTQQLSQSGQRYVATYTPVVGFVGADGFGFVALGAGGSSAEARVAVTVTGVAPVAPAIRATVTNGQTTTIDLTAGAAGGPYTAATIVGVSPANALTATIVEGGTTGNRTYTLQLTPVARFSGVATVTYTLANAFGTSTPATVSVTVAPRADPSKDPTVTGISAAQAEATRRFAHTQLDNFSRRNEQLHHGGAGSQGSPMGISVSGGNGTYGRNPTDVGAISDVAAMKMEHATAVRGAEMSAGLLSLDGTGRAMPVTGIAAARGGRGLGGAMTEAAYTGRQPAERQGSIGNAAGDPVISDGADASEGEGRKVGSAAIWSGGAIALGTRDATNRRGKLTVSSGGLSAGVDVKLDEAITVGVGGGYGADRTKIGRDAGRVDSDSWMGAAYGSFSPIDGLFVDAIAGGGRLKFDTIRTVTGSAAIARGSRDGSMVFGSLTSGFDRTSDRYAISAYGRVDYLSADLDRYAETGAGTANLAFAHRDLTSLSSVLGARGSFVAGAFVPRVRGEWRHEFKDGGAQALDYADLAGFGYAIANDHWLRNDFTLEVGTDYILESGWRFGLDVGGALGQGSRFATGKVTVRKQF